MNIIIYTGQSQYGAIPQFATKLKEEFKKKNCEVHLVDISLESCGGIIESIVNTRSIDLIIGFSGMGSDLKTAQNISYYDAAKIYYLSIYVDHPCQHMTRITNYFQYNLASFLDKSHLEFIKDFVPDMQKMSFFLPLGGIDEKNKKPIKSLEEYKKLKDIDVLFTGTYFGKPDDSWKESEELELVKQFTDLLITDDYMSVSEAIRIVEKNNDLAFSNIGKAQMGLLYNMGLSYVRAYRRHITLEKIFESGISICVYGNKWEDIASKYDNVKHCGNISIEETIDVTRRAKVNVNVNACFTNGAHDRVFTSMLNNSVVFTDKSRYYDEFYKEEESILTYSLNTIEEDIDRLKELLKDDEKLFSISSNAYTITKENHTWEDRANKIIRMFNLVKTIDTIK